jgi:hypothetical protein
MHAVVKAKSALMMMKMLGSSSFGDSTYCLNTIRHLSETRRLLPARQELDVIDHLRSDDNTADVQQWSLGHIYRWLKAQNLGELQRIFAKHSITGDVLLHLNLNEFSCVEDDIIDKVDELEAALELLGGPTTFIHGG